MSIAHISLSGNDGTATLDDPLLPYATTNAAEAAVADGDTLQYADGVYGDTELACNGVLDYMNMDKALIIKATNSGQVYFSCSDVTFIIRFNGAWAGDTIGVEGINFTDAEGAPAYSIFVENDSATAGTINITSCGFSVDNTYSIIYSAASTGPMNINIDDCDENSATTRALAYLVDIVAGTAIEITNSRITSTASTSTVAGVQIDAAGAGCTAVIDNLTVNKTTSGVICNGVLVYNVPNAVLKNSDITVNTTGNFAATAVRFNCNDATLTAHGAQVYNNTILNLAYGGNCVLIGSDATSATDDLTNDVSLFNNTINGNARFRSQGGHAMNFGYCQNGNSFGNTVSHIGIGLLCKAATGGGHFANKVSHFGESGGVGSALQSKGCTNTKYFGNIITIDSDCYGAAFVANADGATNNSGVEVESNILDVVTATPANLSLMSYDASQVVTFKKNAYRNTDLVTNAAPMNDQGTTRTVDAWITNVEDDAIKDDNPRSLLAKEASPKVTSGGYWRP